MIRLIRELLTTAIVNQRIRRQERTDARVIYGEDLCEPDSQAVGCLVSRIR